MRPLPRGIQRRLKPTSPYEFLVGDLIDAATLARAEMLARRWGVLPHDVLIATGWIDAEGYMRALARHCGVGFQPSQAAWSALVPPSQQTPRNALRTGLLIARDRSRRIVYAPGRVSPLILRRALGRINHGQLALAAPRNVRDALRHHFQDHFDEEAREGLFRRSPDRSAKSRSPLWQKIALGLVAASMGLWLFAAFGPAVRVISLSLVLLFLPVIGLRLLAVWSFAAHSRRPAPPDMGRIPDAALPVYTILVPLLREANMVARLAQVLSKLDYPAAKLDIKLILETTDHETIAAARALDLPGMFDILIIPSSQPQTKPKALNAALPFARGDYLVIYDAEDMPEPDQLRKALAAFRAGPPTLACVQARLSIYNSARNWLTAQFGVEYCALFDGLLPAMDRLRLPIPLGGTSNHFRFSALAWLSGWDAYNVTEDADLGIRLARAGYRCATLSSTTFEEAPERLWPWLKQRTRWMKGYLLTWLVHMRQPLRLWRELGPRGFIGFQLAIGMSVLSALVHPWFYVLAAHDLLAHAFFAAPRAWFGWPLWTLALFDLAAGYLSVMALALVTLRARKFRALLPQIVLMPIYWLLISAAAYRALWQFATARFEWEKTDHGHSFAKRHRIAKRAEIVTGNDIAKRQAAPLAHRPKPRRQAVPGPSSRAVQPFSVPAPADFAHRSRHINAP